MAEGAEAGAAKLLLFVATECSHFFSNVAAAVSKYQETGVLPESLPASAPLADPAKKKKGGRPRKDASKDKPAKAKRKPSGGCDCLQHGHCAHAHPLQAACMLRTTAEQGRTACSPAPSFSSQGTPQLLGVAQPSTTS